VYYLILLGVCIIPLVWIAECCTIKVLNSLSQACFDFGDWRCEFFAIRKGQTRGDLSVRLIEICVILSI
jgi:hypothetical protein